MHSSVITYMTDIFILLQRKECLFCLYHCMVLDERWFLFNGRSSSELHKVFRRANAVSTAYLNGFLDHYTWYANIFIYILREASKQDYEGMFAIWAEAKGRSSFSSRLPPQQTPARKKKLVAYFFFKTS